MAAHIGSFVAAYVFLGLLAPLIVLLAKGNTSPFVRRHATESLNFQLNAVVWLFVFALLLFVLIGFVLLPLYAIFYLVVVIIAGVRAARGEEYRYPAIIRILNGGLRPPGPAPPSRPAGGRGASAPSAHRPPRPARRRPDGAPRRRRGGRARTR